MMHSEITLIVLVLSGKRSVGCVAARNSGVEGSCHRRLLRLEGI